MSDLFQGLLLSTIMVVITVVIHFFGLMFLMRLSNVGRHGQRRSVSLLTKFLVFLAIVLGIFFIHGVEIWIYAAAYMLVGAMDHFDTALYFSTVSFSSVGYGDVVLGHQWRIMGAIEAVVGLILIGWSTVFLWSLMGRLRALEHDWLERAEREGHSIEAGARMQ